MKFVKLVFILSALTIFIFACTQNETAENTTPANNVAVNATPEATATPDELAQGRKHYKEQCARCHKEDGTGGKVEIEGKTLSVDDLTTEKMIKEPDEEYIEYMVKGIPDEGMPSFKDILSEEDMKEVVKFIRKELQK